METKTTLDILKMAILMERRGFAFYAKVAENTTDPDIKHVFLVMADEETKHVKFLSEQFVNYEREHKFAHANLPDLAHEEGSRTTGSADRSSAESKSRRLPNVETWSLLRRKYHFLPALFVA